MQLAIASKRKSRSTIEKEFPNACVIDVTSQADLPWVRFSPFYPHGSIPIPFSEGETGLSVEGIWQALKVFEKADVDRSKLEVSNMKGIKRTVRSLGKVLGHRKGLLGSELLGYLDAREQIYLPCYLYVLENYLQDDVAKLKQLTQDNKVVLLDYETNANIDDLTKPLSHAALIKSYLQGEYPSNRIAGGNL
ncbi:MAG: hypothetical protein K2X77_19770 [Candidatus Obscuribacterales bacterium]|jgi:hypothetical protein|nr:hypothetical protein [Candidatus Obscuribacterales bacterium]